jgi:hypothetical protein
MMRVWKDKKTLNQVDGKPNVQEFGRNFVLYACDLIDDFLPSVSNFTKVDRFLLFLNVKWNWVFNEAELKEWTGPLCLQNQQKWIGQVLWFALVSDLKESEKSLRVEVNLIRNLTQSLKDLRPVQMRVEFSECSH